MASCDSLVQGSIDVERQNCPSVRGEGQEHIFWRGGVLLVWSNPPSRMVTKCLPARLPRRSRFTLFSSARVRVGVCADDQELWNASSGLGFDDVETLPPFGEVEREKRAEKPRWFRRRRWCLFLLYPYRFQTSGLYPFTVNPHYQPTR